VTEELSAAASGVVVPSAFSSAIGLPKRSLDLLGAALSLLILSPIFVATFLAIKLTSKGPALFSQLRVGQDGKEFRILKFRSMRTESSAPSEPDTRLASMSTIGAKTSAEKNQLTRVGRFIRRWSIDELPQLWNVLRGDMSLVGPRPFVPRESACITGWAERRFSVLPGMTGLWQVSGRNELTFEEMCRLDNLYVDDWSLGFDVRILFRTVGAVVSGRGVR